MLSSAKSSRALAPIAVVVGLALGTLACNVEPAAVAPGWQPGELYPSEQGAHPRGLLDLRGLIHAHSVYSHDACDGEPIIDGVYNAPCLEDFRRGLCQSQHDFVMLTDHNTSFTTATFPDVLLYMPERGDQLVERNGQPVASRMMCDDGHQPLVLAGNEGATMPVGLEGHVDAALRDQAHGTRDAASIAILKAQGAVVLLPHTEDFTPAELIDLPIDGFEMFNLHANTMSHLVEVLEMAVLLDEGGVGLPDPDLAVTPLIDQDERYLSRWSSVLASGVKRVTTMGTDCHRNALKGILADGERIDSYRRMMIAFSNHLLVELNSDGVVDDRQLKAALRDGRLYGVFELFGYAHGFDFFASSGGSDHEMGAELPLTDAPVIHVAAPTVRGLGSADAAPEITIELLRATLQGWQQVATATTAIDYTPSEAGAYRAVVWITPHHLRGKLGADADALLAQPRVWIYSNALYVR